MRTGLAIAAFLLVALWFASGSVPPTIRAVLAAVGAM